MKDYIYQSEYLKAFVQDDVIISCWEESSENMNNQIFKANVSQFAERLQEIMKTKGIFAILEDSHCMRFTISPSIQVWTVRTLTPLYKHYGIKKHAFVMPKAPITKISYHQIMDEYRMYTKNINYERNFFDELKDAELWVKSMFV